METAIINIKTDIKVKKEAQKTASELGLTLSGAINSFLKQLIRDKKILLSLNENVPSEYLLESIRESREERINKKHHSFKNNSEAIKFLDNK